MPLWWNWQTRWTQNPVVAIPYRFDPGQRHQRCSHLLHLFLFLRTSSIRIILYAYRQSMSRSINYCSWSKYISFRQQTNGKKFAVRLHKLRINFFILQPLIPQKGMSPPLKIANIIQHIMNTTANAILTPLIGTATITMQHIILITTTMNPTINFFIQHLNIVITSTTIQTIITF